MLEHTFSDFGIRYTMANLSGLHLNLRCTGILISLFVTLWKCSTRWFWHVYISRIPFVVFKLSLSKVSWCMQLMLGIYPFQWSVHSEPHPPPPTINIDIMPLSWAYESPVKGTPDVSIEPGLQNCNRWLRNSIIYSTSCQTDDHIPSTIYNYKIQDTIAKVAYTSMPPPYLHSVSLLSKRFVTSLCQHWNESRCLSRRLSSTTSYRGSQICSQWFWITLTQAFDEIPVWAMPLPQHMHP